MVEVGIDIFCFRFMLLRKGGARPQPKFLMFCQGLLPSEKRKMQINDRNLVCGRKTVL